MIKDRLLDINNPKTELEKDLVLLYKYHHVEFMSCFKKEQFGNGCYLTISDRGSICLHPKPDKRYSKPKCTRLDKEVYFWTNNWNSGMKIAHIPKNKHFVCKESLWKIKI